MIIPPLTSLSSEKELTLFWFRRDLRLEDNHGLWQALRSSDAVLPIFIFDSHILSKLKDPTDRRVIFLYEQIQQLKDALESVGRSLLVCYGEPTAIFQALAQKLPLAAVYTNHDYEPYARQRDDKVAQLLAAEGTVFRSFKDQVICEKDEVVKENERPYTVFTPYMRRWKLRFQPEMALPFGSSALLHHCAATVPWPLLTLEELGFQPVHYDFPSKELNIARIKKYDTTRDFPALLGTSQLGVHLRFGTVSVRSAIGVAKAHNEVWLNELIWREFYGMILWHFPHVVHSAFKPAYEAVAWENNPAQFAAWCSGQTGYPIVDAGMRELNSTGYMHNRLRMITASFLTKHLLIDWRWGERYFAEKLLDFELSSNNGGWQWAAGSGCDAAPYFRIFNPYLQTQKFDPEHKYIGQWVPEFESKNYPQPIVDHATARIRTLAAYKKALDSEMRK
jgi:deoxyribodipyrimidine photo-lyase